MSVPQKGHFRLSALSQLTVSLICLPHLEHVSSSGKLSKNIVWLQTINKISSVGKAQPDHPADSGCSKKWSGERFENGSDYSRNLLAARRTGALWACCLCCFAETSSRRNVSRFGFPTEGLQPKSCLRVCLDMAAIRVSGLSLRVLNLICRNAAQISNKS